VEVRFTVADRTPAPALGLLHSAIRGLSTDRITTLVERLENDPTIMLTVGSWRPRCPMTLAGFDPATAPEDAPEKRFATVWDRVAERRRHGLWRSSRGSVARRESVQALLRLSNMVLAERAADGAGHRSLTPSR
jgi:hypothetical protein